MKLEHLNFHYIIKDKEFLSIKYEFSIPTNDSEELTRKTVKDAFGQLEEIIDSEYLKRGFSKEEDGTISSYSIGSITSNLVIFGYNYVAESSSSKTIELKYEMSLKKSKIKNVSLTLEHYYENNEKKLKIYNAIISIPDLELSEDAQESIKKINALANNDSDTIFYFLL